MSKSVISVDAKIESGVSVSDESNDGFSGANFLLGRIPAEQIGHAAMGFSRLRKFLCDQSGASIVDYVFLTAGVSAIAAVFLSFSASFAMDHAQIIQRLLTSTEITGSMVFEEK